MKTLKVGLIVECAPAGLENVVCPKILALLAAETGTRIEYRIETMVNKKLLAAMANGLTPIMCIGETLDERERDETLAILDRQLKGGLDGVASDRLPAP